jgi:polyphenol oxidase
VKKVHSGFSTLWREDRFFIIQSSDSLSPFIALSGVKCGDMGYAKRQTDSIHSWSENELERNTRNRGNYLSALGISSDRVASCSQAHSNIVLPLPGRYIPPREKMVGDGLIGNKAGIFLSVTVADCLPIFLFSRGRPMTCLLHSGWRGTGIVKQALEIIKTSYKLRGEDCTAVIGPGIGSCCYRVPIERANYFEHVWGASTVRKDGDDRYLDLKEANRRILEEEGVKDTIVLPHCTSCDFRFGSFRREGPHSFTRMLALIGYFE